MKKILATILAAVMLMGISLPAYATDAGIDDGTMPLSDVSPRAMLDYQYHWHNAGEARGGKFQVTGNGGRSVRMTVGVEDFGTNTYVEIAVYGGTIQDNGPLLTSVSSWNGTGLAAGQQLKFPISFSGYNTYTIEWYVHGPDTAGRIMCWVYN